MHGGYQNSSYNTVVSEPPEDEGRIDYILLCYQFFSIYIVISMLILLVWDVYFVFKTILLSKDMTQVLLQMYNPVFALIAIGIEADLTDILRGNALMQSLRVYWRGTAAAMHSSVVRPALVRAGM